MTARDVPVTREDVYNWIEEWNRDGGDTALGQWIMDKVTALNLPDPMVDVSGHDMPGDEIPLADLIIMDLPSYTNAPSS